MAFLGALMSGSGAAGATAAGGAGAGAGASGATTLAAPEAARAALSPHGGAGSVASSPVGMPAPASAPPPTNFEKIKNYADMATNPLGGGPAQKHVDYRGTNNFSSFRPVQM